MFPIHDLLAKYLLLQFVVDQTALSIEIVQLEHSDFAGDCDHNRKIFFLWLPLSENFF